MKLERSIIGLNIYGMPVKGVVRSVGCNWSKGNQLTGNAVAVQEFGKRGIASIVGKNLKRYLAKQWSFVPTNVGGHIILTTAVLFGKVANRKVLAISWFNYLLRISSFQCVKNDIIKFGNIDWLWQDILGAAFNLGKQCITRMASRMITALKILNYLPLIPTPGTIQGVIKMVIGKDLPMGEVLKLGNLRLELEN